jgi:hypothetical protein
VPTDEFQQIEKELGTTSIQKLTFLADLIERGAQGGSLKGKLLLVESSRFDMTVLFDLGIGVIVFAATLLCFVWRVPLLGDPVALLLGPFIGLVLSLKHRPPR